ncbi:hypothetical protein F2P81_005318 [Scophthalmus maximus]|uniref:Hermansky-Pudlak syndrome 3 protein n=1 Tax=Scophthalmus maximus TaxID=52904 RepID=A0A6A4T2T5_SCOMX|nr:hypothetical protein F2P81_005318 [Scophthalmus maximus]
MNSSRRRANMVHVYNCHPYASQQIVQVEAYSLEQEGCPLICRFATMGTVRSIQHSKIGDYLVTTEEKNSATYLRAYTNWRHQAEGKARVGVRLLGHLLRGASVRGGAQMEIIEIPLSERPVAVACCPVTGDLLVGCENTLVLFTLRRQSQQNLQNQSTQNLQSPWSNAQQSQGQTSGSNLNISILDFERSVIVHLPKITPKQEQLSGKTCSMGTKMLVKVGQPKTTELDRLDDQSDLLFVPRQQELLGDRAKDCDIPVSIEKTGLEDKGQYTLSYVLFRRFTPEFFQGCSVEETQLHSLQLYPLFTSSQSVSTEEPACVFCFFSLPNAGYLYSLKGGVELLSAYQYPEKVLEAVLTDQLLHVITKNALQCFTVRCAAVAARIEDPYIDTTMKEQEVDNLFAQRNQCGRTRIMEPVEYSRQYAETNPQAQSLRHLLSEAHLLLRAALLQTPEQQRRSGEGDRTASAGRQTDRQEVEAAFRQNCAQLGDCFSRASQKDCHLALPYYRMSGLPVTEVMARNRPLSSGPQSHGLGFLFYLKHFLFEETEQSLSQESADEVVDIFSQSDPSELISVCASPSMVNIGPARTLRILHHLEATAGVSVPLTITMATMMLRLEDLPRYTQLMDRHAEMLLVYGFIDEPRLLLHGGGGGGGPHTHVRPTALTRQLAKSQPGLLVAGMVALHENNKVQLEQADHIFKELDCENCLQVDFWEATLMASSQEAVIQELLFRLASVYIDRLTHTHSPDAQSSLPRASAKRRSLKSADDLVHPSRKFASSADPPVQLCIRSFVGGAPPPMKRLKTLSSDVYSGTNLSEKPMRP